MDHLRSLRWNHDKTFTLITMKFWQNIYDEVSTNHLRSCLTNHLRWNHDKAYTLITMKKSWKFKTLWVSPLSSWGEKIGEKRGEISPLHLNIIFGSFTLITMKKLWQNIYTHVWQTINVNIYFLCCRLNVMLSHFFREVN